MAANNSEEAKKGWVRSEIQRILAEQPQKLYESAKAKATESGKSSMVWIFALLTVALFITGSVYGGLLAKDLTSTQGNDSNWRTAKMKSLLISGFSTCFGCIALAITICTLVYTESVILQNQNRIALGFAFFAFFISILVYMLAIRTRTFKGIE